MESVLGVFYVIVAFLIVLSVHEASHALVAYYLGDSTAKLEGRITLNPLAHLDPMGTMVLLLTQRIGWGKPVPVNPRNFKHPLRGAALTALAGPMSNFVLAFLLAIPLVYVGDVLPNFLVQIMKATFTISIYLGVFNFLPFPPLDGSKILGLFVPRRWHGTYQNFLENGLKYFIMFFLLDWFVLERYFGLSVLRLVIEQGVLGMQLLILWGL